MVACSGMALVACPLGETDLRTARLADRTTRVESDRNLRLMQVMSISLVVRVAPKCTPQPRVRSSLQLDRR